MKAGRDPDDGMGMRRFRFFLPWRGRSMVRGREDADLSSVRKDLGPAELDALNQKLDRLLEGVGVETQPKVAARLLELAQKPDAQIRDYEHVIRVDWALTGRILRLANSAFYAQRSPVTKLDRALVLLGVERIKAVALGFYLSRAAASAGPREMSRRVWGQSVYRASLCSAMARSHCPHLACEAFIVGLMLDCGQPLMARLLGEPYLRLHAEHGAPAKLYSMEFQTLPYTHVDVVSALMRRWRIPAVLARPIAWHHTLPPVGRTSDSIVLLQRLAYYAGAIQLGASRPTPEHDTPLPSIADRLFEIAPSDLEQVVRAANTEYAGTAGLFEEIADAVTDVDSVVDQVQSQLLEIMDEQLERTVRAESRGGPERLAISGQQLEVEPGRNGEVIAYLNGAGGERLVSCTVNPTQETPESVGRMLGLDDATPGELLELVRVMQSMAA